MNIKRRRRPSISEQVENRNREVVVEDECIVGPDPSCVSVDKLIPSGSTMWNLACSDHIEGAFAMGTINTIPGKSQSGKSIWALTMLTECAVDSRFDDYDLIMDDGEHALGFNIEYLFPPLVNRITAPNYVNDVPFYSNSIQDFKSNVLIKCNEDKPFIYVLDSLDSLTTDEEIEKEYKAALLRAKDPEHVKELKGSYKAEKAKHLGEALRMINAKIKRTNSALFIIQQTRQKIGAMFGRKWTTSGGEAPFFYSYHCCYTARSKSITDEVRGVKNETGGSTEVEVLKNKLTGKPRKISFDIYYDYGIDDLSSCIDFLIKTKEIKKVGAWITFEDEKYQMSGFIQMIESNNRQQEIRQLCGKVWNEIEDEMRLKDRQRRY